MSSLRRFWQRYVIEQGRELVTPDPEAMIGVGSQAQRRWLSLAVGFVSLVLAVLALVFFLPSADESGISIEFVVSMSAYALVVGTICWVCAGRVPLPVLDVILCSATLIFAIAIASMNRETGPYVSAGYLVVGTGFLARSTSRVIIFHRTWIVALITVALLLSDPDAVAVIGYLAVLSAVGAVIWATEVLARSLRARAEAERLARKEAERVSAELADVSRNKSEFLAGMSHELRTPLNAIIGFSEVLDRRMAGELNDKQASYVTDIVESGRHLLSLINDVLDLAKVEAGHMDIEPTEVDVASVLENALVMVRDRAERSGLEIVLDAVPNVVMADERKLKQIVLNLLSNAVKFTPPGGKIVVWSRHQGDVLVVAVSDSGPGVALEDQERIFEEFHQSGSGPTRAAEGTGLGLALARQFVELHGGHLWLESTPGHGATFSFSIPHSSARPSYGHSRRIAPSDLAARQARARHLDPLAPVAFIARLGAAAGLAAGIGALLSAIFVDAPDFNPGPSAVVGVFAVGVSLLTFRLASRLSLRMLDVLAVGFIVAASFGIYHSGPLRGYVPLVYLAFLTLVWAFRAQRIAMIYTALVGVAFAVVLIIQPGNVLPAMRWTMVISMGCLDGFIVSVILGGTRTLGIKEGFAREEAERVSAELADVSRHKSEFLAGMSHELRTPLNAIIGFSEVLDRRMAGELNDKQAAYVADIVDSGRHLLSLINDVLDLAKVEAGRMELDHAEVDLSAVLENTLVMVRERAARNGVDINLQIESTTVVADERKLKQVVLNLLSNAVKFTPPDGRVVVRSRQLDDGVEVSIADTGPGVPIEDQERIFEEFHQSGEGPTRAAEGTGLGLALARQFVELHGGRIWVESTPGEGANFVFTIPGRASPVHAFAPTPVAAATTD